MMQRIDPIQSIIANQFVISFKNLSHPGYFFFSGNLLSPYSAFLLIACSVLRPIFKLMITCFKISSESVAKLLKWDSVFIHLLDFRCLLICFSTFGFFFVFGRSYMIKLVLGFWLTGLGTSGFKPLLILEVFLDFYAATLFWTIWLTLLNSVTKPVLVGRLSALIVLLELPLVEYSTCIYSLIGYFVKYKCWST